MTGVSFAPCNAPVRYVHLTGMSQPKKEKKLHIFGLGHTSPMDSAHSTTCEARRVGRRVPEKPTMSLKIEATKRHQTRTHAKRGPPRAAFLFSGRPRPAPRANASQRPQARTPGNDAQGPNDNRNATTRPHTANTASTPASGRPPALGPERIRHGQRRAPSPAHGLGSGGPPRPAPRAIASPRPRVRRRARPFAAELDT